MLKLSLICEYIPDFTLSEEAIFVELLINFKHLLNMYIYENSLNTDQLMKNIKIYLRKDFIVHLSQVVRMVLENTEYATLNAITEILH